ncbi:Hypothetical predicted protein [Paramuricea clavata]|uniref:Uncharacterized protein n=1 Tax=Paramuricea clavata TaxID=317549 RepID=A0A6S7JAH9_PARCT|nr:Hypothetical predicted protein [Paramuricea clavata]
MSFALLESTDDILAAKGNHTIAVVKGKEDYVVLKNCFKDVLSDTNDMVREKKIDLGEDIVNLEFFLGGDYKFILLMMGLSGATSNHACAWCKIHKDERWNMAYDLNHYNSPPLKHTIKEMKELAGKKNNFCCVNPPLIDIDLDHVILDELHLLLRIMDVLINNLVTEAVHWDQQDNWTKRKKDQTTKHLDKLKNTIRSCGVTFEIWEKSNADGKRSGQYDFTSLLGPDKKKLLKELPEKLTGNTYIGYRRCNVTPYMHAMVYHLPKFLETYKTVKLFSGQGVEKNNDVARSIVLRKSNNWDAAADVLKLESRQWDLREKERIKRSYTKKNSQYWEHELEEERKKRRKTLI